MKRAMEPSTDDEKREMLERIRVTNEERCNIPQVLDSLEITVSTVPTLNLYLFELVQNALDVGASKMQFVLEPDAVIFEHNGATFGHRDNHVRGLANVFQSTKSVGSIGFMGFGFKTIYKRFLRVSVRDTAGWSFAFNVDEEEIKLTEAISVFARHWLGAMSPRWDASLAAPTTDQGYTTRFELRHVSADTKSHPLAEDFKEAFLAEHGTSLAILATKGLKELYLVDTIGGTRQYWQFSIDDRYVRSVSEIVSLAAPSDKKVTQLEWLILRHQYVPEDLAVKSLCQSRLKNILAQMGRENIKQVWSSVKKAYTLYGLVPLTQNQLFDTPQLGGGTIFATLPLNSLVPFGIHIQADWLLDLARQGLRDVKTNPWQRTIVENLAGLLGKFVALIPQMTSEERVANAFKLLNMNARNASDIDVTLPEWVALFRKEIERIPFIPVHSHNGGLAFKTISEVFVLPRSKEAVPLDAHLLFGRHILRRDLVDDAFVSFMQQVKLLEALDTNALLNEWRQHGLTLWWATASQGRSSDEQHRLLFALWTFLSSVFPRDVCSKLPCVISANPARPWITPAEVVVLYNKEEFKLHDSPAESIDGAAGLVADKILAPFLPANRFPTGWVTAIVTASGEWGTRYRSAYEWIESFWKKEDLRSLVEKAFAAASLLTDKDAALWAVFALNRSSPSLITHVSATHTNNDKVVVPVSKAVMSAPFIVDVGESSARSAIFAAAPAISGVYISDEITALITNAQFLETADAKKFWRQIFAKLNALGPLVLAPTVFKTRSVFPDYSVTKLEIAAELGIVEGDMKEVNTTMKDGWKLWDVAFHSPLPDQAALYVGPWLELGVSAVEEAHGARYVEGYNRRSFYAYGRLGEASWLRDLQRLQWIKTQASWKTPEEVSAEEALGTLSVRLVNALKSKGLRFKGQ